MTTEENKIQKEIENNVKAMHLQWLHSPMTQTVLKAIRNERERFIIQAVIDSSTVSVTDQTVRLELAQIRSFDAVLHIVEDYNIIKVLS